LKKYFFTGLAILLPVAITIAIVIFILNFLTKPFMGIMTKILSHTPIHSFDFYFLTPQQVIRYGSQILILIGLLVLTLILGVFARWFVFRAFFNLSNKLLHKIPLVNKVYKTTKDIIETLFISDKNSFKQVVMVPFPQIGTYSLGLIAKDAPKTCSESLNDELISVFVPTTPNPTTGFLMMFKRKDMIYLDMKTEEAVKLIVSCGVLAPETHKEAALK
jgi:uncharacterized membrane protein